MSLFLKFFFCAVTFSFVACSNNENPFESVEDNLEQSISENAKRSSSSYRSSSSSSYRSSSSSSYQSSSSSSYRSSSSSSYQSSSSSSYQSSSSSVALFDYLTTSKDMKFTLTYYKQKSIGWDDKNNYTDGDPIISFTVYFIQPNGIKTSATTGVLLNQNDIGEWSGTKTVYLDVPAFTDTIKVCPKVIDEDVLFNDDKSSNYCYSRINVGRTLVDYEVLYQSDDKNSYCILEWEWYLY